MEVTNKHIDTHHRTRHISNNEPNEPHLSTLCARCGLVIRTPPYREGGSIPRFVRLFICLSVRSLGQPGGGHAPSPRNWVHKKISGCAVELNTQNCAWFGSQISLITAMSFREAVPLPPNHPPGVLPLDPAGGLPFPRPPVPLPPNLGYATASVCLSQGAAALGHRHAGCLRLSHHRQPPEMCGLRTRPRTDVVDRPRVELPSAGVGGAHIVSPCPGRQLDMSL